MIAPIGNSELIAKGIARMNARRVIGRLIAIRIVKSISQRELAYRAGLSPAKVSRIECSYDADLRLADIQSYVKALGVDLEVTVRGDQMELKSAIADK